MVFIETKSAPGFGGASSWKFSLTNEFVKVRRGLCRVEVDADELSGTNRLDVDIHNHFVTVNDISGVVNVTANDTVIVASAVRLGDIKDRGEGLNRTCASEVGVGLTNKVSHGLHGRTLKSEEQTTNVNSVECGFLVLKRLLTPDDETVTVEVAEHIDTELVERIALCLVRTNRNVFDGSQTTIVEAKWSPPWEVIAINRGHNRSHKD